MQQMKTILSFSLFFLTVFRTAQSQSVMLGAGGSYGSDIEQFAPNFRVYYGLSHAICFGPEYSYFPKTMHGEEELQLMEYGFVAHYIFLVKDKLGIFPLVGFNYSVETSTEHGKSHTKEAAGSSVGLGLHYEFKNLLPYIEYKIISGELSQSTFSVGLIYNLKFGKNHEEVDGKKHH